MTREPALVPSLRWLLLCVALCSACSTAGRTTVVLFNGTFYANEAASKMLPGQHVPRDYVGVMKDNGVVLSTTQTFTADDNRKIHYEWSGVCDGRPTPVRGAAAGVKLGCTRSGSAIITTLADDHGYSHVEACTLTADHRMEICSGTAELADGSSHDFVYAFDRK